MVEECTHLGEWENKRTGGDGTTAREHESPLRSLSFDRFCRDQSGDVFFKDVCQKKLKLVHSTTHTQSHTHPPSYSEEGRNIRMPLWKNPDHWKL